MIREERDPAFWRRIIAHPQVVHIKGGQDFDIGEWVTNERCWPLASEHGGFLLCRADAFGRVFELHTMFTPEGWGREVHAAALEMFETVFGQGDLIYTHQTAHAQSRPPKSFGWKPAGEFADPVRTWILTKDAWEQSPARRRKCQHLE